MLKKKIRKAKSKGLAVAVVLKSDTTSGRPEGDWASFVDAEKATVISRSIEAKKRWEGRGYGPYSIFVGTLTEEVTIPTNYKVTKLKAGAL